MGLTIKRATKEQSKLRLAVFGPAGSGKTFTSLRLAKGLGDHKILLIDSERGSASKYGDRFDFDVIELEQPSIDNEVAALALAAEHGYGVVIIDSLSHAWEELKDEVDKIGKTKYKGNSWAAWSEGTPKQKRFIDAFLTFPGHVICTMRSKTEWTLIDENGKKVPKRVGLAPEQRSGVEYEFDMLMEMNVDNMGQVLKDRTGRFQGKIIDKPGEALGKELAEWLSSGAIPVDPAQPIIDKINAVPTLDALKQVWIENQAAIKALRQPDQDRVGKAKEDRKQALTPAPQPTPAAQTAAPDPAPTPPAEPAKAEEGTPLFAGDGTSTKGNEETARMFETGEIPPGQGFGAAKTDELLKKVAAARSRVGIENAYSKAFQFHEQGEITPAQLRTIGDAVKEKDPELWKRFEGKAAAA